MVNAGENTRIIRVFRPIVQHIFLIAEPVFPHVHSMKLMASHVMITPATVLLLKCVWSKHITVIARMDHREGMNALVNGMLVCLSAAPASI